MFGIIGIILLILIFFPYQMLEKPAPDKNNLTLTDTDKAIIFSKLTKTEQEKVINYLAVTPTPIIQTVYITPTPDNGIYYADEYTPGTKKLGRPFSWSQENATGLKDITIHARVYGYKILQSYHYFDPTEYKYFETYPDDLNSKFLFVYLNIYMDDVIGDDAPIWTPTDNMWATQIHETLYSPKNFQRQLRIKELEETFNFNDNSRIGYYRFLKTYSTSTEFTKTAGETGEDLTRIHGGQSNAIDGYLVFEIPEDTSIEEISIVGSFYAWGQNTWILKQ